MSDCNCYTCGNACIRFPDETERCYVTNGKLWMTKRITRLLGCSNWKYIDPSRNALVMKYECK